MDDNPSKTGDIGRFEKASKRERYSCSGCDKFEMGKQFTGVTGTAGEEEYDQIAGPDECPLCGAEIEHEVPA